MKGPVPLLSGLALVLGFAAGAHAHAFLDRATPAVGSTVRGPPSAVMIWFTEQLEPVFSTVRVLDQTGKQVDKKDRQVDSADRALLRVSLPPLPPGIYRVIWRVLSVDTHVTEGDFTFEIVP